jgi:GH43 family beta-xylosidase
MLEDSSLSHTYLNPVYSGSFPDPYILKFCGEYYAYCTGFWKDGNVFGVLHSRDLINWKELGGAMRPLDHEPPFYWAPEAIYDNGKFYLYYSVGNETLMEIRVAVSDRPGGGFVDSGKVLTSEDFAIDAHVFRDSDGKQYLFYATDFLGHTHIGTGTVVDEMSDRFTLAGRPRPVTRAKYDWQVYDPVRKEKGGVRWHTVEGPFVIKRKGVYYEMFSGGNWKNISYGVSFATTGDLRQEEEWKQFSDGKKVLPILRTIPGAVTGPGHNSVIRGPNDRELYCIYHCWFENERVLAIDRMDFAGERIFIAGASHTPQIAPFLPAHSDFFETEFLTDSWQAAGQWSLKNGQMISGKTGRNLAAYKGSGKSFLCEFSLRALDASEKKGTFGFCLKNEENTICEFSLFPNKKFAQFKWFEGGAKKHDFELPRDFAPDVFHLVRLEVDGQWVKVLLDDNVIQFEEITDNISSEITLFSADTQAAFAGFSLTKGFEDLFEQPDIQPEDRGWRKLTDNSVLITKERQLFLSSQNSSEAAIGRDEFYADYEFAANIRLAEITGADPTFGFLLLQNELETALRIKLDVSDRHLYVSGEGNAARFPLPEDFEPRNYYQFRFLRLANKMILQLDGTFLGEVSCIEKETTIAVFCQNAVIAFDMVRMTVL